MTKNHVIKRSSLPQSSPVMFTAVMWLLLDRLDAPGWVWGSVGLLVVLVWIVAITRFVSDTEADVPGFGERKK